jgi:hypothetical protein
MKATTFCLLMLLLARLSFAQTTNLENKKVLDSVKHLYMVEAALTNPLLRQGIISTDIIAPGNMQSYLHGNKLFDAKIKEVRTNAIFNVPVKSWGKNSITATGSFFQQHFDLDDIKPYQPGLDLGNQKIIDKVTVGLSVSYLRVDSLFGHQVVYTASITGVTGSASSVQKVNYLGGIIFTMKQTPVTRMGLGLLLNIDPSITFPFVPVFTYWHKFGNGLELNVTLPQQAMLRKKLSRKFWINFGSTLGGSIAFFKNNTPGIPENGNYSTIDIKTGAGFEYRFTRRFMFGMNGGILSPIQAREFEQGDRSSNYFIKNKINTAPYINFSLSVLPFL